MSEETTKRVNYHKNGNLPLFCIEKDTRVGVLYAPFACVLVVRATGLEPAHRRYKILNLTCLPISPRPPYGAVKFFHTRPPFGVVKFFHTRPPFGARGIRAQKGWTLLHVHALLYHVFRHLSSPFSLSVLTNRSARISPPFLASLHVNFPPQAPLAKVLGVLRTFFQEGSKWVWATPKVFPPKVLGSQIPSRETGRGFDVISFSAHGRSLPWRSARSCSRRCSCLSVCHESARR